MSTSKSHLEHWKNKLRKQKLKPNEWKALGKAKDWEIYIQHRGRREWFNLNTANKETAAELAREISLPQEQRLGSNP